MEANAEDIDSIMRAYDNLSTFPDAIPALEDLKRTANVECVVFSNGTRKMLHNSVNGSNDLKPVSNIFSQLVSVDHIQSFKPNPEVYKYLAQCVSMVGHEAQMWLVSGNPFDVVGARAVGMNAAWVDRSGTGWQDHLGLEPTTIIRSLSELVELVKSLKA